MNKGAERLQLKEDLDKRQKAFSTTLSIALASLALTVLLVIEGFLYNDDLMAWAGLTLIVSISSFIATADNKTELSCAKYALERFDKENSESEEKLKEN